MTGSGPSILVVAGDRDEGVLIASTLREAGFAAIVAAERRGALTAARREDVAAAVIALAQSDGFELEHELRRLLPALPTLMVLEPTALRLDDEGCVSIVKRPFNPRQLLGCVFELVLRDEDDHGSKLRHGRTAELGIAAARLACLCNRRAIAAATGASRLAQDLTHQIGQMRASHAALAGMAAANLAAAGRAG